VIALLFPGQGAQQPGMLHALPAHPQVAATLDEASAALGEDVRALDTAQALESTVSVQLALLIAGVAATRVLRAEGVEPDYAAGLSVGAYAAAVACEVLPFEAALRLVRERARLMRQAYPSGFGLAALVGLNEAQVQALLDAVWAERRQRAYLANLNGARQIVIAGSVAALEQAMAAARAAGARRAERLAVGVPSHCELLAEAAARLSDFARDLPFARPRIPYIANRNARALHSADAVRADLLDNIRYPVRWHDSTQLLAELGVRLFIEAPPGQVLTGLLQEALPECRALALAQGDWRRAATLARAT
jgi:malonate decarboxylase epsilon subunit